MPKATTTKRFAQHAMIQRYLVLQTYLGHRVLEKDWHGVADAAMDLREMEAKYPWLKEVHGKAEITSVRG